MNLAHHIDATTLKSCPTLLIHQYYFEVLVTYVKGLDFLESNTS